MDTKKLRQKILDLAIRGKLVPQDPNDEPASVLLERIRVEKERLIKEGKIKRSKKSATNEEIEAPFEIPESWEWCKLIDLCHIYGRIGFRGYTKEDLVPCNGAITLSPSNIVDGKMNYDNCTFISWDKYNESPEIQIFEGDILLVKTGSSFGKCAYVEKLPQKATINPQFVVLKYISCNPRFLTLLLQSRYARENYDEFVLGTAIPTFTQVVLGDMLLPLPSIAEQTRIVNEVERWFTVIDELESNEGDLLKAIDQAKSKILDLAIHGKLVPQDPTDEPAINLLKRINPKFETCDNVYDTTQLPDSWCWAKLEPLSTDSADGPFGSNLKKEHYTQNKEVRIIQLSNIGEEGWREENTKYTTFEHLKDISRSEVMPNDIVIAKMMPAGRAILCPNIEKKYVLSSDAVKFHLREELDCKYILYAINSETFRKQVYEDVQGVTRVRTSLQKLRKYCIPLPPFNEQYRIVAKIEEFFAILDGIKASLE